MAWIGAAIGAGAGILGDVMSQSGQQETNAQSTANMMQQEQWQEQMSNTAMQRRVTDLQAAGLNPMLAVGTNGAQVGSVGQPSLQNPDSSFGNLGNQITGAMQTATTAAQVDNIRAQADKTRADTATTLATLPYSGDTAKANLANMQEQLYEINAQANELKSRFEVNTQNAQRLSVDNSFQQQLLKLQTGIQALDLQRAKLGMPKLENDAAWQSAHKDLSGWLQSGTVQGLNGVVNSAAKVAPMMAVP